MNDVMAFKRSLLRAVAKAQRAKPVALKPAVAAPVTQQASLVNEDELKHEQHRAAVLNCFYNYYKSK